MLLYIIRKLPVLSYLCIYLLSTCPYLHISRQSAIPILGLSYNELEMTHEIDSAYKMAQFIIIKPHACMHAHFCRYGGENVNGWLMSQRHLFTQSLTQSSPSSAAAVAASSISGHDFDLYSLGFDHLNDLKSLFTDAVVKACISSMIHVCT